MRAVRFIVSGLFLLIIPFFLKAERADSLLQAARSASASEAPRLYNQLADALFEGGRLEEAAANYARAADLELQKAEPDLKLVCEGFGNAGYTLTLLDRYPEALQNSQKALHYAKLSENFQEEGINTANIGNAYFLMGNYSEAANYLSSALEIEKQRDDKKGMSVLYNNLGKVYESWNEFGKALEFYMQALELARSLGDSSLLSIRLSSVGMAFRGLKDYNKAIDYMEQAMDVDQAMNNPARMAIRYSNLGLIYQEMGQTENSLTYLLRAIDIFEKQNSLRSLAITYNQLGNSYFIMGIPERAIEAYLKSQEIAEQIQLNATIMKNHNDLATAYEKNADFEKALKHFRDYASINDSLYSERTRRELQELQLKYETEQQKSEIELLSQEKEINQLKLRRSRTQLFFGLGFIVTLLMLIATLYYRFVERSRIQQQLETINATKDRFFAIISHDLKNSLISFRHISSALRGKMQHLGPEQSSLLVNELDDSARNLNDLLDNLLQWSSSQTGALKPKPDWHSLSNLINKALAPAESLINEKSIKVDVTIDPELTVFSDPHITVTVLRNLISNAVKYSPMDETVHIIVSDSDHEVVISVADRGPGLNSEDMQKLFRIDVDTRSIGNPEKQGTGLGLILSHRLMEIAGGRIEVRQNNGKGCVFEMALPNDPKIN